MKTNNFMARMDSTLRLFALTSFLLTVAICSARADSTPSESAAREGYKEIINFRQVYLPLWQGAYPSQDIGLLISNAPAIDSAAISLYEMEFKTRFKDKMSAFKESKYDFLKSVADYVSAAKKGDSTAILTSFAQIQPLFESTSVVLIPLPYPALEKLIDKSKFLSDSLVRRGGIPEMAEATDTIIAMVQGLSPDDLPEKAKDKADLAAREFSYFADLSQRMKDTLITRDMQKYRILAMEMSTRLVKFRYRYLL